MNIFQIFLTVLLMRNHIPARSEPSIEYLNSIGTSDECEGIIEFKNCKNGKKRIFRNQDLKIIAEFQRCKKEEYKFDYILINTDTGGAITFRNNPSGPILFLNKYTLNEGTYKIVLNVHTDNKDMSVFSDDCILTVEVTPPVPVIQGGFQRYIGEGMDLLLNASGSIDYNSESSYDTSNFEYSWMYDCDHCGGFTTAKNKGNVFVISGVKHREEMKYFIKLGIKTKWWKEMVYIQQLVYVRKESPGLEITCVNNCFPPFRDGDMTLMVHCTYHCPPDVLWTWKIYKVPKDDEALIAGEGEWIFQFSESYNGINYIHLAEDKFIDDSGYIVTASLNEFKGIAPSYKFTTTPSSDFACAIKPKSGIVLETKFSIDCHGESFGSYFWVSVVINEEREQILQYDSSWEYLSFIVPRVGIVNLRFTDHSGMEGYVGWDPATDKDFELLEIQKKPEEIGDLYHKGNDSVETLLAERDYIAALDKMTLISKIIANMDGSEFYKVQSTAETLVDDLKKIPMKNTLQVEQATSIMEDLTSVNISFSPQFTSTVTSFCRDLASKYRRLVKSDYLSGRTGDMPIHSTVSQLMQCSSSGNRPNISAIETKDADIEMTTVMYLIEEGNVNTEIYDEYKDEAEAVRNKEMYKNVANSFIDVCSFNGRVLLRRIKSVQQTKIEDTVRNENYVTMVMMKHGYEMVYAPLKILAVDVIFSKDFVDSESICSLIVCASNENIFWWQDDVEILSDIVIVFLRVEKEVVTRFRKPFKIIFTMKKHPKIIHPALQSSVKMINLLRDPEDDSEERLSVYVISLEAGHSLVVHFKNLDEDVSLNVISTTFRLPYMSDFRENMRIINNENKYYINKEIYDYDTFRLIAIIASPPDEKRKNESFEFEMDAYAASCVKWENEGKKWIPGCGAEVRDMKKIVCLCHSFSTITATLKNIPMKKWQEYIPLPVYLEEQYFYGACIIIAIIFFVYSVAICFAVKEEDYIQKAIYFLSDVVRDDRFGFLIIIQTSSRFGSGTTSNVMIRLKGVKGDSEPHVLNYPDPLMYILQRREENWFLLATKNNLGRIRGIELWIDGVGSSPSWNCSTVAILDLQHKTWYRFRISQTFTIYPKPKVYYKSSPIDENADQSSSGRVIIDLLKKCLPSFKLFNLSLRQTDEALSYIKRLTLMLSILTSIAAWCVVINGIPKRNPTDTIMKNCTYTFTSSSLINGIGGSITTATYHIPIKYFFLTSQVQIPFHAVSQRTRKPVIFTVICWLITIIVITFNLTFIAIFGVWIPDVRTLSWTTEILIGMIFYIFVVDVIYSSCERLLHEDQRINQYIRRSFRVIIDEIENQRMVLYRVYGKYLLRPFLQHLYTPLHGVALRILWHTEKLKYEVRELLEHLVMFLIYISLMYMVIVANRDFRNVYSNKQIKKLVAGHATGTFVFEEVVSLKTLDKYIEKTLIEATQSKIWYGRYAVRDPGMTVDYTNKVMGVVRLRQHRSQHHSCEIPEHMQFINLSCIADYFKSQSEEDFGEKWSDTSPPATEGRMKNIWRFSKSNETGSPTYIGKLGVYPGGGYVAFLGRGMKNSLVNLEYLRESGWLDSRTRSIFIEFLLYNANFNIFHAVRYTIEKSALGYLKKEVKVETSKMLLRPNESVIAIPVLFGLFIVLVVVFSARTIMRIKRTRMWYFKDLWHLVDITLIFLSVGCVCMFYRRTSEVGTLLRSLEGKDPKEFVNYFPLLEFDSTFTMICAILIAVATVKLWRLFRFIIIFRVVERTFRTSFLPLCALFFYNAIVILAFAFFGFLLFVDHSYRFEGYFNTVEFLIILNLRPFEGEEMKMLVEPRLSFGYVFYVSYAVAVKLFSCIYTALIIIYYSKAQQHYSNHSDVYSVWDHIKDQSAFYYTLLKIRLKSFRLGGGGEAKKHPIPVSPKADEARYAESFTLSIDKIRAMSFVSLCIIRNSDPKRKPLTQRDIRIMTYALYYLKKIKRMSTDEEEVERFYKGHMGGNKIQLIHETVLKKIEVATSILLGRSVSETLKSMNINTDNILMEENTFQMIKMKRNLSIMLETIKKINIE